MSKYIGVSVPRVDGVKKVTGAAIVMAYDKRGIL